MARKLALALILTLAATTAMAGETIRVVLGNTSWTEGAVKHIPEFEKETGIKVKLEIYGEDQLSQKLAVEFAAGGGDAIDVLNFRCMQEGKLMVKNGWIQDLTPFVANDAEYDWMDYTDAAREAATIDGVITCIPTISETPVIYYRKDIFEKNGLEPPKTLAEMEEIAKKLTDRKNEFYGFIARGQRSPLVTQFSSYLFSYGSDFFDRTTGKSLIDTPEFLEAADYYGRMLRNYGPDGVLNMSWPQGIAVFVQGKGAIYLDCSSQYIQLLDPRNSTVADVTGVAMFPAGPRAHKFFFVTAWGIGIGNQSKNKDAAWKFVRWMTSKEKTMQLQGVQSIQCSRSSAYNDPEGMKNFPADWAKAVSESLPYGVSYDRPAVTAVGEARDIIGEVVVQSILGQDYKKAAKEANAKFQTLLDREGLSK